ncbi:MAG: HEAT repeat domain-containing protein [Kiritimatiellaeota bacterium]|nr:HEAT repeat domain-containing protein [Kiritimatiellota bacterium]
MKLIAALVLFYPLIIPVWKNGPLNGDNTMTPETRPFLTEPEVRTQFELFKEIADPSVRSKMVFELVRSNNPAAVPLMTRLLDSEKDPLVKTDLLKAIFNMRKIKACGKTNTIKRFLNDPHPSSRAYAAALMVDNSFDLDSVLAALRKEKSKFVITLAFKELLLTPDAPAENQLLELLESDDPLLAGETAGVLAASSKNPDEIQALAKIAEDQRLTVRSELAASLAKRKYGGLSLLSTLAKDENSSVRAFVASSTPNAKRLSLYLELSKDIDWEVEVRRLAAISLGLLDDPKSIASLRKAIADTSAPVRKAAETSLIALSPSEKVLNGIIANELAEKTSRAAAVTVLGSLKFAPAAPEILKILAESKNDDVTLRSIKALGQLKYNKARAKVMKRAESRNPSIRSAVAKTLGVFAEKKSFNTLLKLSDDKTATVATEAVKAMGVTKSSFFNTRLLRALKQMRSSAEIRSNACWSIAKTGNTPAAALAQLERLALEQVIPAMEMMEYDSDFVRISAVLALVDLGAKSPAAKEKAARALEKLTSESAAGEFEAEIAGDTLKEFARQAKLYMNGEKKIPQTPYPTTKPTLTATRMK